MSNRDTPSCRETLADILRSFASKIYKELVGDSPSSKNWRGIFIALLVILIVLALIFTAIVLVTPQHEDTVLGDPFTFEDLFSSDYQPRHFASEWVDDANVFVYRSREGEVMEYDADENVTRVVMDNSTFRQLNTDVYYMSPDRNYVLIAYDIERVYRHSFMARYKIYNRYAPDSNSRLIPFPTAEQYEGQLLQYAGWAPTGNALTFVVDNNLWYQASPSTTPNYITKDGVDKRVFNGIADWVYEEEILHTHIAHWWSGKGTYLCYAQFDDTQVPLYKFPFYGPGTDIYGNTAEIAYPKAGDILDNVNPKFTLYIVEPNTGAAQKSIRPPAGLGVDHYFTHVAWQDDKHLLIAWLNRSQNRSIITMCLADTGDCHINQIENIHEGRGWVELSKPLFIEKRDRYLMLLPEQDGNHGFWRHIAMITTPVGTTGTRTYLTQGTWDVTNLLAYDTATKDIYYISTDRDPRHRHLFRVGLIDDGQSRLNTPECVTCELSETCTYVSVKFSKSADYYILQCEGPGVPEYILKSTRDDRHLVMEDNAELKAKLEKKAMPRKEFFQVEVDGDVVWGTIFLPPILNEQHVVQYPLLVHTYGGPGTQQVTDQFQMGWPMYLTSGENVIYASIDGRGSGGRGDRFLHAIYKKLGTLEVQDQIAGAQYLSDTRPYIDKERIAIWGWSYGGFVSIHAISDEDNPIYRCGVAVAPVTDWRYYDTVYTERYMGLVTDNYRGYDNANVSAKVNYLKGKNMLLIHGTADDNVHFQNTAQYIKALTQADVDYRIQIYGDKNHAISGTQTSRHMYRLMTRYLKDVCWDGGEPRIVKNDGVAQ